MKFVVIALGLVGLALAAPSATNPALLKTLETKGTATVIISFTKTNIDAVRQQVSLATFANRAAKITDLKDRLKRHAAQISGNVLSHLQKARKGDQQVELLYVTNQIVIRNADLQIVQSLAGFGEISEIRETRLIKGPEPLDVKPATRPMADEELPWGVADVHADLAWARGINGSGVAICTIDTGVRGSHEALVGGKRASYNWFEPGKFTDTPHDVVGHGTHVTGNIAGRAKNIGVAPGAVWTACLGCRAAGCTEEDLLGCGQWALCPTDSAGANEDCSQAPGVVSCSWGGGNEDPFYDAVMALWLEAGIVPVFAIGNSGPFCSTANSPGDSELAISVGSISDGRLTSYFSSRGPTTITKRIQPDVAAPGSNIYSSYFLSETSYYTMSGTSMATPHVAGLVALLLQADPTLTPSDVRDILQDNAVPHNAIGASCEGKNDRTYPNNQAGHGILEADVLLDAVEARKH